MQWKKNYPIPYTKVSLPMMSRSGKSSRLFTYSILDVRDELDERLERCHRDLTTLTSSMKENELYDQLNIKVCRSAQDHEETTLALLFSVLTDTSLCHKSYTTLTLVTRDGMGVVIHITELLILEKLPKLLDTTRMQLLWLTKQLIQTKVTGADRLCFAFLKQMPAGSTAPQDVWLAENLLHLFLDNRAWLEVQPALVTSVIFTYLSLLPSHLMSSSLVQLQEMEIDFTLSLLRSKFNDSLQIGRDLVRLLQNVARVPKFTQFWFDLIHKPDKLDPSFTGVTQILTRRTSRRFVAGRIVTDSEIKLNFLLSKVKFGLHKRYQEWFLRKYLSTPESLFVIPELIRFVCCVIHPPNEILGSDILPRWAFIGWLLSLAQSNPVVFANAKLSLFYDWLLYNPELDNIMNIEPAALLMFHSLRSHPQITISLLDFVCRLVPQFSVELAPSVKSGIQAAFEDVVKKGVLSSLEPLFCSVKLDDEIQTLLKTTFPDLYTQLSSTVSYDIEQEEENSLVIATDEELVGEDDEVTGVFSEQLSPEEQTVEEDDPWINVNKLPTLLQEKMEEFRAKSDSVQLLRNILELLDEQMLSIVAQPLAHCLNEDFEIGCTLQNRPLHYLLESCLDTITLTPLLSMIQKYQLKLGYYLIYYLYQTPNLTLSEYKRYATDNLQQALLQDTQICANEESDIFFELLPALLVEFPDELIGCSSVINIIVSHIDPHQLNSLMLSLSLKKITMFGKAQLQDIITSSLQWDSFEQFCVWQLLSAESPEIHHIVTLLKHINPAEHPEAISGALLVLKQEPSIPGAVGNLLSLPTSSYSYVVSAVITRWITSKPNKIAKFIDYCLSKVQKLSDPVPTLTPMLDHLENTLKYLPGKEVFQSAEGVLSHAVNKIITKYTELKPRYPGLVLAITEGLQTKQHGENKKRRTSDNDEVIRTKKRRVVTLEELSD